MQKIDITYNDFDGNKIEETLWFHLYKNDLIEMELSEKEGMQAYLQGILSSGDNLAIFTMFKRFLQESYGERDPKDPTVFDKSDEAVRRFVNSPRLDEVAFKLMQDEDFAAKFIVGLMPEDLKGAVTAAAKTPQDRKTKK